MHGNVVNDSLAPP